MVSDAVRRARKVAEMQNEGQKKSENAEFFSLAYKTLLDPDYQDYQREKDLKSLDNSTPQYVKQIMEESKPTWGKEDGGSASTTAGIAEGLLTHLNHMMRITKRGHQGDEIVKDYVPRNQDNPSRVMPVYYLEPQFVGKTPSSFIMDFNEQPRQTVGRNFNCDCSVTAEFLTPHDLKLVSRIHCAFVAQKEGGLKVMDSSQNGTLLNGKLLMKESAKCYPGDLITVGGEKSKAVYKLILLEMGYSEEMYDVKVEATAFKTLDEVREEMEEEIESLPNRELPRHEIPHIQSEIIRGNAMEAMLQSPNVETLWEDIVDCDTIMAAQAFRKYGYSSNPHLSLHGAAGMRALTRDWVGMNHLITQGCIGALLHQVENGLSRARSLALEAIFHLMDSADARATLQKDGGIQVLGRLSREKMGLRTSPNFREVAIMTLEKASVLEQTARVRPHTAIAAGRVYQSTPGRPYTAFGRRMRHPRSAGAGPKSLLQMGRRGSLGATPAERRLSVKAEESFKSSQAQEMLSDSHSERTRVSWQDTQTVSRPDSASDHHLDRPWSAAEPKTRPLSGISAMRPASAEQQILRGRPPPPSDGIVSLMAKEAAEQRHRAAEAEADEFGVDDWGESEMRDGEDQYDDQDDMGLYDEDGEDDREGDEREGDEDVYMGDGMDGSREGQEVRMRPSTAVNQGPASRPLSARAAGRPHSAVPVASSRPSTPSSFYLTPIRESPRRAGVSDSEALSPEFPTQQGMSSAHDPIDHTTDLAGPMTADDLEETRATHHHQQHHHRPQQQQQQQQQVGAGQANLSRPVSAVRFADQHGEVPPLSRPMSAAVSVGSSEASALPTRVGTPSAQEVRARELEHAGVKGSRSRRPGSAAPSRSGKVNFEQHYQGMGGSGSAYLDLEASRGQEHRGLPLAQQATRRKVGAAPLCDRDPEEISDHDRGDSRASSRPDSRPGSGSSVQIHREQIDSSELAKEIFQKRMGLRQMEEEHRRREGELHANIAELQSKLNALKGGSLGGDHVMDQVLSANSRPGTANRVREAVTASRNMEKDPHSAPPPLPVARHEDGRIPKMYISQSLGEEEHEASIKHGASNSNYTISITHSGDEPFVLTHMHSSEESLFSMQDVKASVMQHRPVREGRGRNVRADDLWGGGEHEAITKQKEIVRQFEELSEHEQRSLLHDFADRFWAEFLFHQGFSKKTMPSEISGHKKEKLGR